MYDRELFTLKVRKEQFSLLLLSHPHFSLSLLQFNQLFILINRRKINGLSQKNERWCARHVLLIDFVNDDDDGGDDDVDKDLFTVNNYRR